MVVKVVTDSESTNALNGVLLSVQVRHRSTMIKNDCERGQRSVVIATQAQFY